MNAQITPLESRNLPAQPACPWRWSGLARWLAILVLGLGLSGCALVSTYDPVTDAGIQQFSVATETIFADSLGNGAGYAAQRENYRAARGVLAAVAQRAALYGEKNAAEQRVIANLQRSLSNLEKSHRLAGKLREGDVALFRVSTQSLMHHELSKKNSTALANPDVKP